MKYIPHVKNYEHGDGDKF